jgi:hypothetical protein
MKRPNIKLHIEELVLHGFPPRDRYVIADAVERELSHLLARQFSGRVASTSLTNDVDQSSLDAGAFHVAPNARPNSIGAQIARAVHGGLAK